MPSLKYCTCAILTAMRHLVLASINWMAYGTVEKVPSLHEPNRLRH